MPYSMTEIYDAIAFDERIPLTAFCTVDTPSRRGPPTARDGEETDAEDDPSCPAPAQLRALVSEPTNRVGAKRCQPPTACGSPESPT